MEQMTITYENIPCGAASIAQEGLYFRLECSCLAVSDKILRVYAVCGEKTLCLGVLLPEGGRLTLTKKLPACRLPGAIEALYIAEQAPGGWLPWEGSVEGCELPNGCVRSLGDHRILAAPYEVGTPLPYLRLFRRLSPQWWEGKLYLTMTLPSLSNKCF